MYITCLLFHFLKIIASEPLMDHKCEYKYSNQILQFIISLSHSLSTFHKIILLDRDGGSLSTASIVHPVSYMEEKEFN